MKHYWVVLVSCELECQALTEEDISLFSSVPSQCEASHSKHWTTALTQENKRFLASSWLWRHLLLIFCLQKMIFSLSLFELSSFFGGNWIIIATCLIINILYENVLLLQLLHTCDNVQDATGHIGDTKQINYITTSPCHLHPTCEDLDKKYTRNRTNIIHL